MTMKKSSARKGPKAETPEQVKGAEQKVESLELVKPLTAEEKNRLGELGKVIDAKLGDFFDVGSALMEIKTKELYRETHKNFNTYCQERWDFGRSYANKLIGSAERIRLLPADVPKPANEFQLRPFLKLEPEEFPKKWQAIVKTAGEGKVTYKIVEESLDLSKKKRRKRKAKAPVVRAQLSDEVQELVEGLRTAIKEKDVEVGLKQLDKLQKLLKV